MRYFAKIIVLILILTLLPVTVFADNNLIIKGLYEGGSEWKLITSGTILGFDYKQTNTYTINEAYGLGVEYEFKKKKYSFSGGLDYFGERDLTKWKASRTIYDGTAPGVDYKDKDSGIIDDRKYQVYYLFAKGKYYLGRNFFVGGILRKPNITLKGSGWNDDLIVKTDIGFGYLLGFLFEDFNFEAVFVTDKITWEGLQDYDGNDITSSFDHPLVLLSLGYVFSLDSQPTYEPEAEPELEPIEEMEPIEEPTPTVEEKKAGKEDLEQLEKLYELKEKGVITEEEYEQKKKQILGL